MNLTNIRIIVFVPPRSETSVAHMYMFRSLSNDTVKKFDTHVCTSFFDFFQTLIRRKLLGNWLNRYVKRLQKFTCNRTLSKRIVGETTVIPRASLFPSLCLLRVSSSFVVISYCFYLFRFRSFSRYLNFNVIFLTVTFEDVCCYIRNTKSFKSKFFATCVVSSCLLPQVVYFCLPFFKEKKFRWALVRIELGA